MTYKRTTLVPNTFLDDYLPHLSEAELKVLLIVIRQTIGWKDFKTGKRKVRDRITHSQFKQKTGLSPRSITNAIHRLTVRKLIQVTDYHEQPLPFTQDRKGKSYLYFQVGQRKI